MKGELDVRCSSVGKRPAFAPDLEHSRKTDDQDILFKWFLNEVADYPFNERVAGWSVGYAFDFFDLKNTQIGLPLVVTKQWIVIGAKSFWKSLVGNGRIKHTAQGDTIDFPGVHTESDNAS